MLTKDWGTCTKIRSVIMFSIYMNRQFINPSQSIKKKKLYGPFLRMGFNCLKAKATLRRQFTFYHQVHRNSWYSFYRPLKDERLIRPWSHPVVLNTGPLDWESSILTTRSLLHVNRMSNVNHKLGTLK